MDVELQNLTFDKEFRHLVGTLELNETFPKYVVVHSPTGRVVKFVQDEDAARNNEFWDGEMMQYRPVEYLPKVDTLTLGYRF